MADKKGEQINLCIQLLQGIIDNESKQSAVRPLRSQLNPIVNNMKKLKKGTDLSSLAQVLASIGVVRRKLQTQIDILERVCEGLLLAHDIEPEEE